MNKTILTIFGWLIILATVVVAQNNNSKGAFEKQRLDRENLDTTAALSASSRVLHKRLSSTAIEKESAQIVQEAVLTGDRSIIPYLKARKEGGYGPMQSIDLALVALGETQYVQVAIDELKSENYSIQYYAIWKLARFKTKKSYSKLFELLDDVTDRDPVPNDDAIYRTLSEVTKDELFSTVDNPPSDQYSTKSWKEWFAKNKHLIE